jgi:uncharacterized protein YjdB
MEDFPMKARRSALLAVVLATALLPACDESEPGPAVPRVVSVTPAGADLMVGEAIQLVAATTGLPTHQVTWSSAAPAVATVDTTGLVKATGPGTAVIVAASVHDPNARGAAAITVAAPPPPPPVEVRVEPGALSLVEGSAAFVAAIVTGTENRAVTWSSASPAVATVSADGLVTGVAPGTAVIVATSVADPAANGSATVTVTQSPPPVITVVPASVDVTVGGTAQLTAIVTGTADTRITWESLAPAIVSVDTAGLVTGLAQGAALVYARSVARPDAVGIAQVVVHPPPAPTLSIQVTTPGGGHLNPLEVKGLVGVRATLSVPATSGVSHIRLSVVTPGAEPRLVETRSLEAPFTGQQFFTLNTAAFEEATGMPFWRNVLHQVRVDLVNAQGAEQAAATSAPLTFANENVLHMLLRTEGVGGPGSATVGGSVWREGDVVATAVPVRYAEVTYSGAEVCIRPVDGPVTAAICRSVAPTDGAFQVVFPKAKLPLDPVDPGTAGITTTALRAYGGTVVAGGGAGPAVLLNEGPAIRLDNVAPAAFTLMLPAHVQENWLNADFTFTSATGTSATATATNLADEAPGVGGVTVTFHVVPVAEAGFDTPANNAALARDYPAVTAAAELESTTGNAAYVLVAAARDALGNVRAQRLGALFGVDLVPPSTGFAHASIPTETVNPAGDWVLTFSDAHSGLGSTVLEYRIRRHRAVAGAPVVECVVHAGASIFAPVPADGCQWIGHGTTAVPVPQAQGFYTAEFRVRDRAGNASAPVAASALRDLLIPDVTGVSAAVTGGAVNVSATLRDDVGLAAYDLRYRFDGGGLAHFVLPGAPPQMIAAYGLPLVGVQTVTGTLPLIRGLQVGVGGPVAALEGAGVGAYDGAGNFRFGVAAAAATFGGISETLTGWQLLASEYALCLTGSEAACAGVSTTAITLTAQALTDPADPRPFERVLFYYVHPHGHSVLIGTSTQAASDAGAANRIWTWQGSLTTAMLPAAWWTGASGTLGIFAVAVDAEGDAIMTSQVTIDVY